MLEDLCWLKALILDGMARLDFCLVLLAWYSVLLESLLSNMVFLKLDVMDINSCEFIGDRPVEFLYYPNPCILAEILGLFILLDYNYSILPDGLLLNFGF